MKRRAPKGVAPKKPARANNISKLVLVKNKYKDLTGEEITSRFLQKRKDELAGIQTDLEKLRAKMVSQKPHASSMPNIPSSTITKSRPVKAKGRRNI